MDSAGLLRVYRFSEAATCSNSPEVLGLYWRRPGENRGLILVDVGALSIQRLEGSRFARGGRYGILIDFGLEVIEKQMVCGAIFKSKFIGSDHQAQAHDRLIAELFPSFLRRSPSRGRL
jgi:hypothetical protein